MTRKTPLLGPKEREQRHKRFKIACALAGPGASKKLAAELGLSQENLLAIMRHRPERTGKVKRCWRVETYCDRWVREQFRRHAYILRLSDEE